ncbi:uncharacterized protein LOC107771713 [Nicotiana tabacum]|uniref:Uncharacterized protein LOC107771713 n=1 Tax=Nicotiana tabacum TaxID=4097 RepID=A0A1S3Y359_TOBAC|nr:PREDICTED: uncharacterized protein LOC107771713 [Nicotiana tabacum]
MECVQRVNYTVMINGEPSEPFNSTKSLRQGDPMSPFLFAITIEYLNRKLNELKEDRSFQFHPKCAKLGITHLIFADDLLLFAKGNLTSIIALHKCFSQFSEASGLQANLGRIQLVKYVLFGIQAYWAQLFLILAKVLKTIDVYCRSYVWSGSNTITRKALVAWDRVCTPKSVGGLNLINIKLWNQAAQIKTCWDIAHKQDKMWIRWIHAYYVKGNLLKEMTIPSQASWITRKILEAKEHLDLIPHVTTTRSMINSIYKQPLPTMMAEPWKYLMFKNDARPKVIFTIWLQLQGRLATTNQLVNWGLAVDPTCTLCQNKLETRNRLFAECEFTKAMWRKMQQWLQIKGIPVQTWDQHTEWAIYKAKGKS